MFCSKCGNPLTPGSRFCPACGNPYTAQNPVSYPQSSQLVRPRAPRVIAGVCSGLAQYYGWDLTVTRLILVLCVLFAGTGVLAYIIAWIVIPEAPYALTPQTL